MRTQYTQASGVDIAYQVVGDGPVDILLHTGSLIPVSCMDDEPSLARFHRRLASFGRLVRFDRRGVGLSDRGSASQPPTSWEWVADGIAVLDAIGSAQAAIVAPFTSASEGIRTAAAHADRVSHLVIINGSARGLWAPDYTFGVPQEFVDAVIEAVTSSDAMDQGHNNLALMAPSMAEDAPFRAWWDRAGNLGATPAMARAILTSMLADDTRELLPSISAPTLVLHRGEITTAVPEHGRFLAAHIPGATYVEIPGQDIFYWVGDTRRMLDEIEEFLTGSRSDIGAERVLATVLFTDIVGSTQMAATMGDSSWRNLLDRHDHAVRQQLARFRGTEVVTVGDGFFARFDSPGRGIECALAIRQALGALGIDVRAGLHTGEIELRDADVAGMAVHIGARVSALAGAGEVLVSSSVPPLVSGSAFAFTDRGEHELKGVPGTWRVFAVT